MNVQLPFGIEEPNAKRARFGLADESHVAAAVASYAMPAQPQPAANVSLLPPSSFSGMHSAARPAAVAAAAAPAAVVPPPSAWMKDVPAFLDTLADYESTVRLKHRWNHSNCIQSSRAHFLHRMLLAQIPDESVQYLLERAGCNCQDPRLSV
jgi:hypothetical protein